MNAAGVNGGHARLDWVDVAKGWGIILVVIGHVWTKGFARDLIYAFHMPLFFILSGYTTKPRAMGDFLPKLTRSMVIPYIAFLIMLALFDWAFETWRGNHPLFMGWKDALWRLSVGGSELRGPFTIFWFVPALYFGRIIYNAIAQLWASPLGLGWFIVNAMLIWGGVALGAATDFSPLGLLSVPLVVFFLWLGACWRALNLSVSLFIPALLIAPLVMLMLRYGGLPPLNMKVGDYGDPWISIPGAVALSVSLCAVARLWPASWLGWLGRASLVIMYLHVAVIHYLTPYFAADQRWIIGLCAISLPILLYSLLNMGSWTQKIFLGK